MTKTRNGRDLTNQSLPTVPRTLDQMLLVPIRPLALTIGTTQNVVLNGTDDRRTYDPTRPSRNISPSNRNASRLRQITPDPTLSKLRFNLPNDIPICARRKRRRAVLHALGMAGRKGNGAGKKRKTNHWSKVKC